MITIRSINFILLSILYTIPTLNAAAATQLVHDQCVRLNEILHARDIDGALIFDDRNVKEVLGNLETLVKKTQERQQSLLSYKEARKAADLKKILDSLATTYKDLPSQVKKTSLVLGGSARATAKEAATKFLEKLKNPRGETLQAVQNDIRLAYQVAVATGNLPDGFDPAVSPEAITTWANLSTELLRLHIIDRAPPVSAPTPSPMAPAEEKKLEKGKIATLMTQLIALADKYKKLPSLVKETSWQFGSQERHEAQVAVSTFLSKLQNPTGSSASAIKNDILIAYVAAVEEGSLPKGLGNEEAIDAWINLAGDLFNLGIIDRLP